MARKLYRFANRLMVLAVVLGVVVRWARRRGGWLHAKLALVLATIGYHHACRRLLRDFEQLANRRSQRWYRVFNEVSVLLFAAMVVLVVVKPF